MEVDDVFVTQQNEQKKSPSLSNAVAATEGRQSSIRRNAIKSKDPPPLKETLAKSPTPEDAASASTTYDEMYGGNVEEQEANESVLSVTTPLKLEVSATEDEDDSQDGCLEQGSVVRRQLLVSPPPLDERAETEFDISEEGKPLKRKRYEVRRSGSEECLLGFNEQSGEAEFTKEDVLNDATAAAALINEEEAVFAAEATCSTHEEDLPMSAAKKLKRESPQHNIVAAVATSPTLASKKSSPRIQAENSIVQTKEESNLTLKSKDSEQAKPHIVADNEEINGNLPMSVDANVKLEVVPASVSNASTASTTAVPKKTLAAQDEFYKKPFEYGWKRELVWRATLGDSNKDRADVYFIAPSGKKLRARSDIVPLLEGDLTLDHFCFAREPLGVGPELEIVRHAKPSSRVSLAPVPAASPVSSSVMGKRISKPKGPKGASPPPQGWTPTRALKVNNAALLSSNTAASRHTSGGGVGSANPVTPPVSSRHSHHHHSSHHYSSSSSSGGGSKNFKSKKHANDIENDLKQINDSIRNSRKTTTALDAVFQAHNLAATASTASAVAAVEQSNKLFATNFFANVSFAYDALLCILKYLKIHERPRAASVCKLWHLAAKDTSLWHTVRMKNSKVCNWSGFAAALRRGETKHLDLRKMLLANTRGDDMWTEFSTHIGTVCTLETIDLCRCSARVVENLFQSNKNLRVLNAVAINDDTINFEHIALMQQLEELRLRTIEPAVLTGSLQPLQTLTTLMHLSLTALRGLGTKAVEVLAELTELRSLELGECGDFNVDFAQFVLPQLGKLQRLRLENGQETSCCTLEILESVAKLEQLSQLELVNFDIKPGFDDKLSQCLNIRKLLIIPTYISQSATTNHIVLNAVQQVADSLRVFTWGVTVELLRVTALYVDQCEESTKKEKHHFDECIPVLKPVPGAPTADIDDDEDMENDEDMPAAATASTSTTSTTKPQQSGDVDGVPSEVPQIEILPLDKVESILGENLPQTKFTIVKVPYHATCKQQLVE